MQKQQHLLVIRMSAMGDVAMAVPVIKALIDQNPNLKVTFVSKGFLKPLFEPLNNVTFFTVDTKHTHKGLLGIYKLYKTLKPLHFDGVADLHNVLRSKVLRSFFKLTGTPIAYIDKGRAEKKALTSLTNKVFKPLKSTHQRYADVFNKLFYTLDLDKATTLHKQPLTPSNAAFFNFKQNETMIGIAPFAAHEGKKYPLHLMEKVIKELAKKHKILLFGGGQQEVEALTKLENTYTNTFCIAGKVKLEQELNIISNLSAMISMDSGNGHFAALYNIPTVTIWGATHPYAGFVPFQQNKNCICADRTKFPLLPTSVYGNKIIPGYENVMHSIEPNTIINKVLSLLA